MKFLVTGAAGFIGSAVSEYLLKRGDTVVGVDNLNDYYDVSLKHARLERIAHANFSFRKLDVADGAGIAKLFANEQFEGVVHLAAQAGVRYSIENPAAYTESNLTGFTYILEGCRHNQVGHLVYASSSSVYGANTELPFSEAHSVDHPVSFYAATKKANELMAHSYSHLYDLPTTGLRYFTVYGPWGRPDMALFSFTKKMLAGEPIDLFNHGHHTRDFTFIDDIVEGTVRALDAIPSRANASAAQTSVAPWRVFNIGNNQTVELAEFVSKLESCLGITAKKNLLPMQAGDVLDTSADVSLLEREVGYRPKVNIADGIRQFVDWYKRYFEVKG